MKKQHINIASRLADEIVDFADFDFEIVSATACIMAAATFIAAGDLDVKKASSLLADYVAILKKEKE
jgi:hypothetical protein